MIAASDGKGTVISHICRSCSLFGGEDVPVPILVPVFSTQSEQSTSLSDQPPEKVRSGVPTKQQRFFSTFCHFLTLSFSFSSEHRNSISSAQARHGLVGVPIVFRSCFWSGTFVKNRNTVCFSTFCICSLSRRLVKKS